MKETRRESDYPQDIRLIIPPSLFLLAGALAMALLPLWPPAGEWLAGDPQRVIALYTVAGAVALLGMVVYDTRVSALERVIVWRRSLLFVIPLRTRRLPMEQIAAVDIDHSAGADCSRADNDTRWRVSGFSSEEILFCSVMALSGVAADKAQLSIGGRYRIILQTRQRDRYLVFRHARRDKAVAVAEMLSARTGARLT